jgi:hypothetical protein
MFVQVMEGRVRDREGLKRQLATWMSDLAPGAHGWLGATAGVTADGVYVAAVRFESEEAATANSERPEQGAWWEETKGAFDGDVTFTNCPEADTFGAGGSDDAGFVQMMHGRADRSVVAPAAAEIGDIVRRMRPDVLGGLVAWPGDGTFVQVVYFTSEEEARKAESAEPSPEHRAARERLSELLTFDRFIDLPDPWLYSP